MTVNLCPFSGVSVPRFRGICAPFPPPFLPFCAPFQGYLVKDIKDLKVFKSRGNAGIENRLIPLNRIKKRRCPAGGAEYYVE